MPTSKKIKMWKPRIMRSTECVCGTHAALQPPKESGPELLALVTACSYTVISKIYQEHSGCVFTFVFRGKCVSGKCPFFLSLQILATVYFFELFIKTILFLFDMFEMVKCKGSLL